MYKKPAIVSKTIKTFFALMLIFSLTSSHLLAFNHSNPISIYHTSDTEGRDKINITSIRNTNYINFFVEQNWWNSQNQANRTRVENFANILASEFEHNIYPKIKTVLPNVVNWINFNDKIQLVLTPMGQNIQGYVKQEDFYSKNKYSESNEGKVVYLNVNNVVNQSISNNILFSFFSHELMHVLSYQEKNVSRNVDEEVWMEELRSEFLPHFLGYNSNLSESYINFRLKQGINISNINFLNWSNTTNDYTLVNLFAIYMNQRYSSDIIFETLKSHLTGIDSINYYLIKNGFKERFDDVYQDWIIANAINDCKISDKYCYKNFNLNINIPGNSFYLPVNSNSVLSISDVSLAYQAKYQKIIGGGDTIELTFENPTNNKYRQIPYVLTYHDGRKKLDFLSFNGNKDAKIIIKDYKQTYQNITLLPIFSNNQNGSSQLFKWHINSTVEKASEAPIAPERPNETQSRDDLIIKLQLQLIDLLRQLLLLLRQQRGI